MTNPDVFMLDTPLSPAAVDVMVANAQDIMRSDRDMEEKAIASLFLRFALTLRAAWRQVENVDRLVKEVTVTYPDGVDPATVARIMGANPTTDDLVNRILDLP